ncbi:MAG TPA: hypothetical protein VFT64_02415 [Rickettsiales bacterium]|nr:hypothetical protein [Rickettsiales bacterium]
MATVGLLLAGATAIFLGIAVALPALSFTIPFIWGGAAALGVGLFGYMNHQKHQYEARMAAAGEQPERAKGMEHSHGMVPHEHGHGHDNGHGYGYDHNNGYGHDHGYAHGQGHAHEYGSGHHRGHDDDSWAQSVLDSREYAASDDIQR